MQPNAVELLVSWDGLTVDAAEVNGVKKFKRTSVVLDFEFWGEGDLEFFSKSIKHGIWMAVAHHSDIEAAMAMQS